MIIKKIINLVLMISLLPSFSFANDDLEKLEREFEALKAEANDEVLEWILSDEANLSLLSQRILLETPIFQPPKNDKHLDDQEEEIEEIAKKMLQNFLNTDQEFQMNEENFEFVPVPVCMEWGLRRVGVTASNEGVYFQENGYGLLSKREDKFGRGSQNDESVLVDRLNNLPEYFAEEAAAGNTSDERLEIMVAKNDLGRYTGRSIQSTEDFEYYVESEDIYCKNVKQWKKGVIKITPDLIRADERILTKFLVKREILDRDILIDKMDKMKDTITAIASTPLFEMYTQTTEAGDLNMYNIGAFRDIIGKINHKELNQFRRTTNVSELEIRKYFETLGRLIERFLPVLQRRYSEYIKLFPNMPEERLKALKSSLYSLAATLSVFKDPFDGGISDLSINDYGGNEISILSANTIDGFLTFVTHLYGTEFEASSRSIDRSDLELIKTRDLKTVKELLNPREFQVGNEISFFKKSAKAVENGILNYARGSGKFEQYANIEIKVNTKSVSLTDRNNFLLQWGDLIAKKDLHPIKMKVQEVHLDKILVEIQFLRERDLNYRIGIQ